MTEKEETAGRRKWVVAGPAVDEDKRNQWWVLEREGDPYQHDTYGKMGTQHGDPFGNFIHRKWADETADFVNDLEAEVAELRQQVEALRGGKT